MPSKITSPLRIGFCALVIGLAAIGGASATEGYFVEGAGSANSQDAFTTANNPAGLVDVGHQISGDLSIFNPTRQYNASGTGLVAPGNVRSGRDIFLIPALGYAVPLSGESALGVTVTGNGGMNTTYYGNVKCALGAPGVFCGGKAGVDLNQALITVGYAQRFGQLSLGVAPVLAVQVFSAYGLGAFGQFGLSSDPSALSDRSPSYSVGGGVRRRAISHQRAADRRGPGLDADLEHPVRKLQGPVRRRRQFRHSRRNRRGRRLQGHASLPRHGRL